MDFFPYPAAFCSIRRAGVWKGNFEESIRVLLLVIRRPRTHAGRWGTDVRQICDFLQRPEWVIVHHCRHVLCFVSIFPPYRRTDGQSRRTTLDVGGWAILLGREMIPEFTVGYFVLPSLATVHLLQMRKPTRHSFVCFLFFLFFMARVNSRYKGTSKSLDPDDKTNGPGGGRKGKGVRLPCLSLLFLPVLVNLQVGYRHRHEKQLCMFHLAQRNVRVPTHLTRTYSEVSWAG